MLPAFLKIKGLVKQHLDSFNHFVEVDLMAILRANNIIKSEVDHGFWIKYHKIWVGQPERYEVDYNRPQIAPMECRLRDITYSAMIYVDIEYTKEGKRIKRNAVPIGRLPVMLRSRLCSLYNKNEKELARMGECSMDPGGYFVVKGTEKVRSRNGKELTSRLF